MEAKTEEDRDGCRNGNSLRNLVDKFVSEIAVRDSEIPNFNQLQALVVSFGTSLFLLIFLTDNNAAGSTSAGSMHVLHLSHVRDQFPVKELDLRNSSKSNIVTEFFVY